MFTVKLNPANKPVKRLNVTDVTFPTESRHFFTFTFNGTIYGTSRALSWFTDAINQVVYVETTNSVYVLTYQRIA